MSLCMTMKAFWQKRGVCCMLITMSSTPTLFNLAMTFSLSIFVFLAEVDEFTPKVCAGSSEKNEALFSLFTRPNSAF
eukprot:m.36011 g.36011  ORF g.36011 m.36011 type:complete len:77 (+) comp44404_c0_seq2:1-231(+)